MTRIELKAQIEATAKECNATEIEIISIMQGECAARGDEKMIETLADIKWDYIG